jgi:D-alanyl-D-alanine carboxypeptidase
VAVAAGGATAGSGGAPPRDAKLRSTLASLVSRANAPGGVLVVQTPAGIWRRALGQAQLKPRKRMAVGARFRVASVTKPFTPALVLRLVADGILSLDDPVERWLPGRLPEGAGAVITVRDLLRHTSGIADPVERLSDAGPDLIVSPPGPYRYANRNYILLGRIIGAATGSTYDVELAERILKPLGLTYSELATGNAVPAGLAHGYLPAAPRLDVTALPVTGAHAGLVSDAADLARFERALFSGRVIPRELVAMMQTPRSVAGYTDAGYYAYGLGLMRFSSRCGSAWGHFGRIPGYMSWMLSTPDGRRTVVALLNDGELPNPLLVRGGVHKLVTALSAPSGYHAPSRTSASSGRAASTSIAWLRPSGTTQAGSPIRVTCSGKSPRDVWRASAYSIVRCKPVSSPACRNARPSQSVVRSHGLPPA